MIIDKSLESITREDIELLTRHEKESTFHDFKSTIDFSSDYLKAEFIADIVSFSNTYGGDLIIGVKENTDRKFDICGFVFKEGIDSFQRCINDLCMALVDPPLSGVRCRTIEISSDISVIIVRCQRSQHVPHRIKSKTKHNLKFYGRNESSKYEMSMHHVKASIFLQEDLQKKLHTFKKERHDLIKKVSIVPIWGVNNNPTMVIHLIPLSSLQSSRYIVEKYNELSSFPKLSKRLLDSELMVFDGKVSVFGKDSQKGYAAYTLLMRNGALEIVDCESLCSDSKIIDIKDLKDRYEKFLKECNAFFKKLNFVFPMYFSLSILNIKSCAFKKSSVDIEDLGIPIQRDYLIFPDHEIISYEEFNEKILFNLEMLANSGNRTLSNI